MLIIVVLAALLAGVSAVPVSAGRGGGGSEVRFATFNASLNRFNAGDLAAELSAPGSAQPDVIAEIIQRVRPDVLLINEFDYDAGNVALDGFQTNYLSVAHGTAAPIVYPYRYTAPSNTGIPSGLRPRQQRRRRRLVPNDAYGFGFFPGQFGMAVYSMYPIDFADDPDVPELPVEGHAGSAAARRSADPAPPTGTHPPSSTSSGCRRRATGTCRSRSASETVHFLVSHPTPPVFDGARGPQRHPQPRRDPLLGRLRAARRPHRQLHLRRRRRVRAGCTRRDRS